MDRFERDLLLREWEGFLSCCLSYTQWISPHTTARCHQLIVDKKLAPFYPGQDDEGPDVDECPICFLNYPGTRDDCWWAEGNEQAGGGRMFDVSFSRRGGETMPRDAALG